MRVLAAAPRLLSMRAKNAAYCELVVRVARAQILTDLGHARDALPDIEFALAGPSGSPKYRAVLLVLYGRALLHEDRTAQAITVFQQVLAIDPGNIDARNRLELAQSVQRSGKKLGEMPTIAVVVQPNGSTTPPPVVVQPITPSKAVGRTHDCRAFYPKASKAAGETGDVLIGYDVGVGGAISNVQLVTSSGNGALDDAALLCVRKQWRNTPALQGTTPVASPGHQAIVRFFFS